jgi:prephenate dehydrogenase
VESCDPDAVGAVEQLIALVGADSVHISAAEHDRAVARTSHVPQLLASALLARVAEAHAEVAAGPAYRGATRTAGGGEAMWRDIFSANADEIAVALREIAGDIESVARGLAAEPVNVAPALQLLASARRLRDR